MSPGKNAVYEFGPFRLLVEERLLLHNGRPVPLTPKNIEMLIVLVENHGRVVLKDTLMSRVWPDVVVQEDNITYNVSIIRKVLGDGPNGEPYIETVPKRGYWFVAAVTSRDAAPEEAVHDQREQAVIGSIPGSRAPAQPLESGPELQRAHPVAGRRWLTKAISGIAVVAMVLVAACLYVYVHYWEPHRRLTEQDTVVLADFANTTGDPVFDGTLRQGLAAQLEQSPFLNLLSDARIAETLGLMAQPKDARLTRELAREVCQRTASAATIEGSIATLGSQYVLGLAAVNCRNGDLLAETQATADTKEHVLKALGEAATKVRERLGESLASVERYDTPPENVTTPSLEALQAYSVGRQVQRVKNDPAAAIPFFERAVKLDPNFAMAWSGLAANHANLGEGTRAVECARRAYELRDRVSERERFYITAEYEFDVTGDEEASRKLCELWAETYPRYSIPRADLGTIYSILGEYDKSLAARQEALRLDPRNGLNYANLIASYLFLNRLEAGKVVAQEARTHNLDSPLIHYDLYAIAFLQHDAAGMEHETASLVGKPGSEDYIFYMESDTAAYAGQFAKARELSRRAADSAQRAEEKEAAGSYVAEGARREALIGNMRSARLQAQTALRLADGIEGKVSSALALALAGDSRHAMRLADDLSRQFPKNTPMQLEYLPVIRAAVTLGSGKASKEARRALQVLAASAPYELGNTVLPLYSVYLRGEAYLAAHEGAAAAAEFQKVLDHSGVVTNDIIGALARLGVARAYALEAQTDPHARDKARTAYQNFLTLWKDADPDIPIYQQAKAEYAKLQ